MKFSVNRLLSEIAPQAICADCIRDRAPIANRRLIQIQIDDLEQTEFELIQGECVTCYRIVGVIRRTSKPCGNQSAAAVGAMETP